MNPFKQLTDLRAERAVLRSLKSGRPRKFNLVLTELYREFSHVYHPQLEAAIADAFWRLRTMGLVRLNNNRKYQLVKSRK